MNTNIKLVLFAVLCTLPLFVWIYPSFWDWMNTPVDSQMPLLRIMAILAISFAVFGSIYVVGNIVIKEADNDP